MRVFNCYNSKIVYNKYTKQQVVARCGKCPACLNARAASWVTRLDFEMSCHPYTYFVTFQYDEFHVQQYIRLRDEDNPNKFPSYINSETGQIISLSDLDETIVRPSDIQYCKDTKVLLVHDISDFQKFIKRLRKHYSTTVKDAKIRYYAAFEYGPTTYRPHIHCLFFLDSSQVSETFADSCIKYWQYGNTFDPHIVSGSCSSYVASYLNCSVSIPRIYLHPVIKSKAVFSKCPPIGFAVISQDKQRQIFDSEVSEVPLYIPSVHKFNNVPLWRSYEFSLFPKCTCFNRLSHDDRVALFKKGARPAFRYKNFHMIKLELSCDYWQPFYYAAFYTLKDGRYVFNEQSLKKFVSLVCRVYDNALKYGISIDDYVTKIENYYVKKQKSDLRKWYLLQDTYFKDHPLIDFLTMNVNVYSQIYGRDYYSLQPWLQYYIALYAPEYVGKVFDYSISSSFGYQELIGLHNKISFDNTKQKKSNDYLLAHRDKFNNIITYNQLIENE